MPEFDSPARADFESLDRKATSLFAATSLVVAISVGAIQVSGWHAGILDDRVEVLFWAGAVLGAVGVALLGAAALPVSRVDERALRRIRGEVRWGILLFLLAPVLCVVAVFADYWI